MQAPLLKIEKLDVGYKNRQGSKAVVTAINATLYAGEVVALIGMNGAGKSTLLRTLSAFQPPLSGNVEFAMGDVERLSSGELAKCVSVVLTENNFATLTVDELVSLGRTPYTGFLGRLTTVDKNVVAAAMERMGVSHLAKRAVSTLSDGERQKCLIAKAIAQQTPLMLLDEPTAFLDLPNKYEICLLLRRLAHKEGKSILFSTHDLSIAIELCDTIAMIEGGEFHYGTAEMLIESGEMGRIFERTQIEFDRERGNVRLKK